MDVYRKKSLWTRLEQELDACLITVDFFVSFFYVKVNCFCPVVLEKRRGFTKKNPADVKTVRYCFITFPLYLFWDSLSKPPPLLHHVLPRETTSKLLVRLRVLFSFCLFIKLLAFVLKGERKLSVWMMKKTKQNIVALFLHASVKTFHSKLL